MTLEAASSGGLSDPQPLFLSQFLRLPLRKLDAVNDAQDADSTLFTSAPVADSVKSIALPDSVSSWSDFKEKATQALQDIPDAEGYQHILPPPAFRKDCPSLVHHASMAAFQPSSWYPKNSTDSYQMAYEYESCLVLPIIIPPCSQLQLDEELAYGDGRGPLQLGDHLARHNVFSGAGTLPRQVVFRSSEKGIRAPVLVRAPWVLSIPSIFSSDGITPLSFADMPAEARSTLQELHGYMAHAKSKYALLTTYNHFVFLRLSDKGLELSPPIASESTDVTVYTALWLWARYLAAEE